MSPMVFHRCLPALVAALLCCCNLKAYAEKTDTLVDSKTLIQAGIKLHDEGKYKEALAFYNQVPEGDTNFALALNERALSAMADSSFAEGKKLSLQGLALPDKPYRHQFLLILANSCDYMGDHAGAAHYYDTLLQMNPYDYQAWYEKGAMFLIQENLVAAQACFRHSLMLNPNHFRSHFNMGVSLYKQGRFAEAYLALCFSLFSTTEAASARRVLTILTAIQQQNDEVIKAWQKRDPALTDPAFEEADAIINAKLALSKDYKYESVLSGDATINILHLILEKVNYNAADTNLVMQYYLPFYKQAYDNDKFDPMMLLMFSGYNIDVVERQVKKQTKAIDDFRGDLNNYTDKIASTQTLDYTKRKTAPAKYAWFNTNSLFIVGGIQSKDPFKFNPGEITVYKAGNFAGRGTANAAGDKIGEWVFYYDNGNIESRQSYKDGNPVGEGRFYRRNGTLSSVLKYNSEGKAIEKQDYTYGGMLDGTTKDQGDKAEYVSYHWNDAIEYRTHLKDGKVVDPTLQSFFDNGSRYQEINFANGKREGQYREYFRNGKLYEEIEYSGGDREGKYASYFRNGQLRFKSAYHNGKFEGPYEEYNQDGKLIERGEYHNGKKTGTMELLSPDGRVYGSVTYRKDLPVAYQFTDDAGKVLSGAEKNGEMNMLTTYYANGNKMAELPLQNGKTEGVVNYYYPTGSLKKTVTYKEDNAEGPMLEYFHNGRKESVTANHDNQVSSFYKSYTDAGNLRSDGFLQGSQRNGLWHFYHPDGKPETEMFYVGGKKNGPEKNFRGDGSLEYTYLFDRNLIVGLIQYDTTGAELRREYFPAGEGVVKQRNDYGQITFTANLHYGSLTGPYTRYFPNGSISEKGYYKRGNQDSTVVAYHHNGLKAVVGQYTSGQREGLWTYYDLSGSKTKEVNYTGGEQDGEERVWIGGILDAVYPYKRGSRDGREVFYGEHGETGAVMIYVDGIVTGYTYQGKDGKEVPVIPLKNASGHVITFYANGQKSMDFTYVEGRVEGLDLHWYTNGQKASERTYTTGMGDLEGPYHQWSPTGQMLYEANYHNDIIYGNERHWTPKGQLISSVDFAGNGTKHGVFMTADPASGKKVNLFYYYGTEVRMN